MRFREDPEPFESFARALPWLGLVMAVFFLNIVSRLIFSPLMPNIEADLGLSHAQAGRIFLYVTLGFSVSMLFSSHVSSRLPHRVCVGASTALAGIALIVLSRVSDLALTYALLWLLGVCAGLYPPSGFASITSLVAPRDFGKAIAIHDLGPNLAFIAAPALAALFLSFTTWRGSLALLGAMALGVGALHLAIGRGGEFTSAALSFGMARDILWRRAFWLFIVLICVGAAANFGPYSMLPLFLADERGMSTLEANRLLAVSRLAAPFASFGAGLLADRLGARRTMFMSLLLGGAATFVMAVAHGGLLVAAALLQPVFTVCFFPAAFTMVSRHYDHRVRSVALSLLMPVVMTLGAGMAPAMLGWAGEHGMFAVGFIALAVLMLAAAPAPLFLGRVLETSEHSRV